MANGVTWDGHDLTDLFVCGFPSRVLKSVSAEIVNVPGGFPVYRASERGHKELSFTASLEDKDRTHRKTAMLQLAAWLDVDSPRMLEFHDDDGLYYMAVPSGDFSLAEHLNAYAVDLTFYSPDGILYGARRSASLPSGGTVAISIGGTAPTPLMITAAAAKGDSSTKQWGLTDVGSGRKLHVNTGSTSARKVDIDCGERTVRVAGAVSLPTLDSDWMMLEPGEYELSMSSGTGAAEIEWQERWL